MEKETILLRLVEERECDSGSVSQWPQCARCYHYNNGTAGQLRLAALKNVQMNV